MNKIENPGVEFSAGRWAGCFKMKGKRYHVWFSDIKTLSLEYDSYREERILYMNPLRDVKYKADGWFETRKLNAEAKVNYPLILQLRDAILSGDLVAKKQAELDEAERKRLAAAAEQYKKNVKESFGPELYDALKRLVAPMPHSIRCEYFQHKDESECDCAVGQARSVIKEIEAKLER